MQVGSELGRQPVELSIAHASAHADERNAIGVPNHGVVKKIHQGQLRRQRDRGRNLGGITL